MKRPHPDILPPVTGQHPLLRVIPRDPGVPGRTLPAHG